MDKDVMFSSKTDQWETPKDFFDDLDALFHFTLDACALPENAKCEKYFTPEMDGLKQEWGGRCLVQPSIRERNWPVGRKGISLSQKRMHGGHASPGEDGHKMVPRVLLYEPFRYCAICKGAVEVWRKQKRSTVSIDGCDFQEMKRRRKIIDSKRNFGSC